jgi:hypothetical protein
MSKRLLITIAVVALLTAACGDDDVFSSIAPDGTGGGNEGTTTVAEGTTGAGGEATTITTTGEVSCADLVTLGEAEALFGEPAMFDAEESREIAGVGAGSCVYSSIEDPDNTQDLTSHLLQVMVYQGAEYYTPDMWGESQAIEGIGDEAFVSSQLGVSTGFRDGDVVGFVSYSVIDLSGTVPDAASRQDQVVDLLRLVHDRLT